MRELGSGKIETLFIGLWFCINDVWQMPNKHSPPFRQQVSKRFETLDRWKDAEQNSRRKIHTLEFVIDEENVVKS